jgi:hypothetical protein
MKLENLWEISGISLFFDIEFLRMNSSNEKFQGIDK